MFAKLATFRIFNRTVERRAAMGATPCNDNKPGRVMSSPRQLRRPVLLCRWHKAPSGVLECSWGIAGMAASNAEEPEICRLIGRVAIANRDGRRSGIVVTVEHIARCSLGYRL